MEEERSKIKAGEVVLEPAFIMASAIDANIMKRALMQVEGVSVLPLGTSECNQPARAPYPHTNSACAPATRAEAAGARRLCHRTCAGN